MEKLKRLGILALFAFLLAGSFYLLRYTVLGRIWYWLAMASIILPFIFAMFAGTLELYDSNHIKTFLWIPIGILLIYGIGIFVFALFQGFNIAYLPSIIFIFFIAFIIWLKLRTLMIFLNLLYMIDIVNKIREQGGSLIPTIIVFILIVWSTILVFKYRKYRGQEKSYNGV